MKLFREQQPPAPDPFCTDFDIINAIHNTFTDKERTAWALDLYARSFVLLQHDKTIPQKAKDEILNKIKSEFKLIQLDIDIAVSIQTTKYLKSQK